MLIGQHMIPIANATKRGAKLALLMLVGAATAMTLGVAGLFMHPVSTHDAGLAASKCDLFSALIGAGGGLVAFYLVLPILGPRFAALNARMQADSWREPKAGE